MTEQQVLALVKCLADKSRLQILKSLTQEDIYVEHLAERLGLSPSTISFHLKKLAEAGAVNSYKTQYYTMYTLEKSMFMTTILDLDAIAIGGGISREALLIDTLQQKAEHLNANNPCAAYSAFYPKVHIRPCTFHNEANMVGALYHHLKLRGLLQADAD